MKKLLSKLFVLVLASTMTFSLCCGCGAKEEPVVQESLEMEPDVAADPERIAPYYPREESFAGGDGTEENPYQVATAGQLALMAYIFSSESDYYIAYDGAYFEQTADIVINDPADIETWNTKAPAYNWKPIGSQDFTGTFDGNGYKISGLYIYEADSEEGAQSGLFSGVSNAVIRNITLVDSYISSDASYVGGIVADSNNSHIENCYASVVVEQELSGSVLQASGGVVAYAYKSTLQKCIFEGSIRSMAGDIGGIAGYFSGGSATDCVNRGNIEGRYEISSSTGGIFGTAQSGVDTVIENCRNEGSVSAVGNCNLGGIAGQLSVDKASELVDNQWIYYPGSITLKNCINTGSITGNDSKEDASIGGIAGTLISFESSELCKLCAIENCTNSGEITANGYTGGVMGSSSLRHSPLKLSGCVNEGKVSSSSYAGGIMGYCTANQMEESISYCTNTGEVESGYIGGGILGAYFGFNLDVEEDGKTFLVNCYNSGKVSGNTIGGIVGAGMDVAQTVCIDACINIGEIVGEESTRAGGILGTDALASFTKIDWCTFKITDCVNLGNIYQGNGQQQFDSKAEFAETAEKHVDSAEAGILLMGGNCIGGIVGSVDQSILENCVNCGQLFGDANVAFIRSYADISSIIGKENEDESSKEVSQNDDKGILFAGGICGQYLFMDETDNVKSTGIYNCIYEDSAPISYSECGQFDGEDTIVNVLAEDYVTAMEAAEKLMKWH